MRYIVDETKTWQFILSFDDLKDHPILILCISYD